MVQFSTSVTTRERWHLLNPGDLADRSLIRFGAPVALSCYGHTTCCLSLGPIPGDPPIRQVRMIHALGATERWKFVDPANAASGEPVPCDAVVALRAENGPVFHLSCGWNNAPPAPTLGAAAVPQCAAWEILRARLSVPVRATIAPLGTPRRSGPGLQSVTGGARELLGTTQMTVVAGEQAGIELQVVPNSVEDPVCSWDFTGNPIGGYNDQTGVVTDAVPPPPGSMVQWVRWIVPGDYTITLTVEGSWHQDDGTMLPGTVKFDCRYNVVAPMVYTPYCKTGEPTVRPRPPLAFGAVEVSAEDLIFDGCLTSGGLPDRSGGGLPTTGILMRATVRAQAAAMGGTLRWVQLIRSLRKKTEMNGPERTISSTGGQYWLDGAVSYSEQGDTPFPGSIKTVTETDAPSQPLVLHNAPTVNVRAGQTYSVEERFKMYLMWRSDRPNCDWVTLGRFDWFWEASATRGNLSAPFALVPLSVEYTNKGLPDKRASVNITANRELPTWSGTMAAASALPLDPSNPRPPAPPRPPNTDISQPQGGQKLMVVRSMNGTVPYLPGRRARDALSDIAAMLMRRKLGPPFVRIWDPLTTWWPTWCEPAAINNPFSLFVAQEMPKEWRKESINSNPLGWPWFIWQKSSWFHIKVAPFCFGDIEYWQKFARAPVVPVGSGEDPGEGIDYSLEAYLYWVQSFDRRIRLFRSAGDPGSVWMNCPGFRPTPELIDGIAGLTQTFRIESVADNVPRLLPIPEQPRPYPRVEQI